MPVRSSHALEGRFCSSFSKHQKTRVATALVDALNDALSAITASDCAGWFRHAGYAAK
jgi:hypothetical protein